MIKAYAAGGSQTLVQIPALPRDCGQGFEGTLSPGCLESENQMWGLPTPQEAIVRPYNHGRHLRVPAWCRYSRIEVPPPPPSLLRYCATLCGFCLRVSFCSPDPHP